MGLGRFWGLVFNVGALEYGFGGLLKCSFDSLFAFSSVVSLYSLCQSVVRHERIDHHYLPCLADLGRLEQHTLGLVMLGRKKAEFGRQAAPWTLMGSDPKNARETQYL